MPTNGWSADCPGRCRAPSCMSASKTAASRPTRPAASHWPTAILFALLDHDDVLYPNALFEVVQTIQSTGADFVYSDEIVLSADLKQLGGYHFKPDFAPDYLRGVNFITHLAVFSRPLLDAAGAYESKEFDGAQDQRPNSSPDRKSTSHRAYQKGALHLARPCGLDRRRHGGEALRHRGGGARHRRAA